MQVCSHCIDYTTFKSQNNEFRKDSYSKVTKDFKSVCAGEVIGAGSYGKVYTFEMKINGVFQEVVCKHQQLSESAYKNDFLKIELKYGQDFGYLKTFPDIYGCA